MAAKSRRNACQGMFLAGQCSAGLRGQWEQGQWCTAPVGRRPASASRRRPGGLRAERYPVPLAPTEPRDRGGRDGRRLRAGRDRRGRARRPARARRDGLAHRAAGSAAGGDRAAWRWVRSCTWCPPRTWWGWTRARSPGSAVPAPASRWPASSSGAGRPTRSCRPAQPARSSRSPGSGCCRCRAFPGPASPWSCRRTRARPSSSTRARRPTPSRRCSCNSASSGSRTRRSRLGIATPKVGLLTIGAEPGKGNVLTRRAHELLASVPPKAARCRCTSRGPSRAAT